MSLNIKNPEAHQLASEIAKKTGETLTEAVTQALREKLARLKGSKPDKELMEDMQKIAHDIASRMSPETKELDVDELLYDELGMPK